ncbi:hypothetical protein KKA66_04170 [Patescibacteria group bacterium]|nr:hypothetical protein [Patescibacteria group bacterium]
MDKEIFRFKPKKRKPIIVNIIRVFFVCLIIFEILNFLKILNFTLEFTWLGLIITAIVSLVLLEVVGHKYKQKKKHSLHWSIWLIVLAGLCLDVFGDIFHFYGQYNWWDQVVHMFISAVTCFTLFTIISAFWIDKFKFSLLFKKGRLILSLLLATTTTMTLSALYEIEEYLEDIIFHTNRLGPGTDTVNDLVFNLFGVLIIVIFVVVYYQVTKKRKII